MELKAACSWAADSPADVQGCEGEVWWLLGKLSFNSPLSVESQSARHFKVNLTVRSSVNCSHKNQQQLETFSPVTTFTDLGVVSGLGLSLVLVLDITALKGFSHAGKLLLVLWHYYQSSFKCVYLKTSYNVLFFLPSLSESPSTLQYWSLVMRPWLSSENSDSLWSWVQISLSTVEIQMKHYYQISAPSSIPTWSHLE